MKFIRLSKEEGERYEAALQVLFEEYYDSIYKVALSITLDTELAQDATQEAFYKAFLKLDTLKDKGKFYPWLYSIVVNVCKDMLRLRSRDINRTIGIYDEEGKLRDYNIPELGNVCTPEDIYEDQERIQEIIECIEELTIEEQQILNLKYYHEFTYAEIAEILGIKEGTAKMKAFRARKKIIQKLEIIECKEVHRP